MKLAQSHKSRLYESHLSTWRQLWSMGLSISHSLAADAINGDQINATMYYAMSQTPYIPLQQRAELQRVLLYSEGCYGGLHTLYVIETMHLNGFNKFLLI
jgi:hypothetical protein